MCDLMADTILCPTRTVRFHKRFRVRFGVRCTVDATADTKSHIKSHLRFGEKKRWKVILVGHQIADTVHQIASLICIQIAHLIAYKIARVIYGSNIFLLSRCLDSCTRLQTTRPPKSNLITVAAKREKNALKTCTTKLWTKKSGTQLFISSFYVFCARHGTNLLMPS
jgi:hypothetical protein